ncbi:DUF6191 domain-containing protein [Streptomyces althioticus]|uniref:DUF6191 domain-containing protein n=1 Tax=Streptomyces TaxID=1883 RepID=UPI0033F43A6F|nr:DUF6191 domain-containing protein [Streptomyces althioticus]
MFNAFEELFSPGRKHTQDEQKRLALSREDVGDADPGRGPIDLASGKVTVRRPATADEDTDGDDAPDGTGGAPGASAEDRATPAS